MILIMSIPFDTSFVELLRYSHQEIPTEIRGMSEGEREDSPDIGIQEKQEYKTKEPELYKVVIHNDHYTTREFVVEILESVFHRSQVDAINIMMTAHRTGKAVCGIYTLDIARTKVDAALRKAKQHEFPLRFTVEGA